jgi:hypothetical protein
MEKIRIEGYSDLFHEEFEQVLQEAVIEQEQTKLRFLPDLTWCYSKNGHNFYFDKYGCENPNLAEYQYWPSDTEEPEIYLDFKENSVSVVKEDADGIDLKINELKWKLREEEKVCESTRAEIQRLSRVLKDFTEDYHAVIPTKYESLSELRTAARSGWNAKNHVYKNRILARQAWISLGKSIVDCHVVKLSEEEVQGLVVERVEEVCGE